MSKPHLRRAAVVLGSMVVAAWTVGASTAWASVPGSNGKIAVTTEAYPGPCGDCDPGGGRAWLLGRRGRPISLPARTVAFSPSGTRVAYEHADGGIWIARADGSRRRLLSRETSTSAWSPRGGLLAYHSFIAGGLIVRSPDRKQRWRLPTADFQGGFAWSPDGDELAFASSPSLGVVGFRGRHQRTVVPPSQTPPGPLQPIPEWLAGVEWSRSGWLSYLRGSGELAIVRPNGGDTHTLATGIAPCCGEGLYAYADYSWSPGGERIAFVRDGALWVMRVPDGTPRMLVPRGKMGVAPQWSPDGRLIAYVRGARPAGHRLLTVPASGGEPKTFARFNDRNSGEEFVVDIDWQARPRR